MTTDILTCGECERRTADVRKRPGVPKPLCNLCWQLGQYPRGGPPAPGHRTLNEILRDAIRARGALILLRREYDEAATALFDTLSGHSSDAGDQP